MRIGIVVQNFPPARFEGGISHYSALLGEHLSGLGHNIYAITSSEFTLPVDRSPLAPNVKIIQIPGPWNFKTLKLLKSHIDANELDVIILQYSPASFETGFRLGWALRSFACQKITAFHTLWGRGIDRIVGILTLIGSSKIIATNSEIMTILEKRLPNLLKRTYWIPIGSNIPPSESCMHQLDGEAPLLVYFGMFYPGKGLNTVLGVAESLKKKGRHFLLKIVGGGGPDHESYVAEFESELVKRNLSGVVEHLGYLPAARISEYMRKARVIFLPYDNGVSDRRGSFMAAIAHGKTVLTSPPVVNMPFLHKGVNVMWPEDHSVSGYADLLESLLIDDNMINKLENGASRLARKFSWKQIALEYELVIRQQR